jgi:hypothetical protein
MDFPTSAAKVHQARLHHLVLRVVRERYGKRYVILGIYVGNGTHSPFVGFPSKAFKFGRGQVKPLLCLQRSQPLFIDDPFSVHCSTPAFSFDRYTFTDFL